jgi:hypothetical protein
MPRVFRSFTTLVCTAFLVIAGFFLITEHTAHAFGILSPVASGLSVTPHAFIVVMATRTA